MNNNILAREWANKKILENLSNFFTKNPELRFIQGLYVLGFLGDDRDRFYEESIDTLKETTTEDSKVYLILLIAYNKYYNGTNNRS